MDYKTDGQIYKQDNMQIIHADCMEIMKQTPDNYYSLAICDPPYGINVTKMNMGGRKTIEPDKNRDSIFHLVSISVSGIRARPCTVAISRSVNMRG